VSNPDAKSFAREAENAAANFLRKRGYRILHRNYTTRVGEIDLIASDHRTICFVEVKGRSTKDFGSAEASVTPVKQKRLRRTAQIFLARNKLAESDCRFDVVAVTPCLKGSGYDCELILDAF